MAIGMPLGCIQAMQVDVAPARLEQGVAGELLVDLFPADFLVGYPCEYPFQDAFKHHGLKVTFLELADVGHNRFAPPVHMRIRPVADPVLKTGHIDHISLATRDRCCN